MEGDQAQSQSADRHKLGTLQLGIVVSYRLSSLVVPEEHLEFTVVTEIPANPPAGDIFSCVVVSKSFVDTLAYGSWLVLNNGRSLLC